MISRRAIRVLEVDPELGAGIDRADRARALGSAVAAEFWIERGPWNFFPPHERGALGALVIEGLIVIRLQAAARAHIEPLGEGDVISPWVGTGDELSLPSTVSSTVVSPVRIALLDRGFAVRVARWPEIQAALIQRLIVRARRLSLQAAINAVPRISERLEATLWALAYRWGRVTAQGISFALPMTHLHLAEMMAAQRPSISLAFARLQAEGKLTRNGRSQWLLRGEPPATFLSPARQTGLEA